jgi:hypothetical protein
MSIIILYVYIYFFLFIYIIYNLLQNRTMSKSDERIMAWVKHRLKKPFSKGTLIVTYVHKYIGLVLYYNTIILQVTVFRLVGPNTTVFLIFSWGYQVYFLTQDLWLRDWCDFEHLNWIACKNFSNILRYLLCQSR